MASHPSAVQHPQLRHLSTVSNPSTTELQPTAAASAAILKQTAVIHVATSTNPNPNTTPPLTHTVAQPSSTHNPEDHYPPQTLPSTASFSNALEIPGDPMAAEILTTHSTADGNLSTYCIHQPGAPTLTSMEAPLEETIISVSQHKQGSGRIRFPSLATTPLHANQLGPERQITQGCVGSSAVLTTPMSLDGDSDAEYRAPNMLQIVLSILKNVRPGSDITRISVPPSLNLPKSHLQCYGESVYCTNIDLLSKCAHGETALDRFTAAVAWNISTMRHLSFGISPYSPILGETHHVSKGSLNVLLEQVSHHPPVTALYATDEKDNIQILWCHNHAPKFNGTHVEVKVLGERELRILKKNETYTMNAPNLVIRFLPFPGVDWEGNMTVRCKETGLEANICYKGSSFLSRQGKHRSVKGNICRSSASSSSKPIYEISGNWDRTVSIKDTSNGKVKVIYNAKEALTGLKTPLVKDPKDVLPSESVVVWAEVSRSILKKQWDKAKEAKIATEERQRELDRDRKSTGENWIPKYFKVSYSKENGWKCFPHNNLVSSAPIIVPI